MNVIVVGGGQVGSYIAEMLIKNGCHVRVIERRESVLEKLRAELPKDALIVGGGADPSTLEEAGVTDADVLVAVTGADEINLVASTIAKYEFGVPRVIARVNNPKNEWLFDAKMGVDILFNQALILAHLVVDEIDLKNMVTLMKLNRGNNSIIQVSVDDGASAANQKVKDLQVPENTVLIAVHRGEEILIPRGDTTIEAGDHILALTNEEDQQYLDSMFSV